jgi:hypothetical protein
MKKQKANSICNSELYGIQENEENEIQKQSIDDDTCHNSCQSSCDTENHCLASNMIHYTGTTKKEFIELAQKDKVNYNLWLGTGQYRKYGYVLCFYCGHIAKKKECVCSLPEKQLVERLENYLKISPNNLDNLRFCCNLIETLKNHVQDCDDDEIQDTLDLIGVGRMKYKCFSLHLKTVIRLSGERKYADEYWCGLTYGKGHKQIWVHIGKDKKKYKEKLDSWLSKPDNQKKLSDKQLERLGINAEKF